MSRIQTPYSHIIDEYNKMISKNIKAIDSLTHSNNIRQIADDTPFTLSTGEIIIVLEGVIAVEMQEHNFILTSGKAKTQPKSCFRSAKASKGCFLVLSRIMVRAFSCTIPPKKMSKCSAVISNTLRNILLSPINSPS